MGKKKRSAQLETKKAKRPGLVLDTAVVLAALYLGIYVVVALLRLGYPFELEWMEGGAVDHVARVLNGQAIYVRPSIDFVPYIYTPLYYYLCAPIASLTGVGFLPLRLVSVLSSFGCFVLLFWWARRETSNWKYGVVAAGLYAASFRLCGAWFDIARADSLFVFLVLSGAYALRFAESKKQLIMAAVLLWLSFLAKQTAQFICVPLLLYALVIHRMRGLWYAGVLGGAVGLSVLVLDWLHEGWFTYYIFHLPSVHKLDSSQWFGFWVRDILRHIPIMFALSLTSLLLLWKQAKKVQTAFYIVLAGGCIAASWASRLFSGGYDNALMPALAALSVIAVILMQAEPLGKNAVRRFVGIGAPILLCVQFAMLWYNPVAQVPSLVTRESGQNVIKAISTYEGDVYMPYHGFVATLAGKKSYAHAMALKELEQYDSALYSEITLQVQEAYTRRRFSLVIMDPPGRGSHSRIITCSRRRCRLR